MKKLHYAVILSHETYNSFSAIACAKFTHAKLINFIWDPVSYIIPRVYGKKIPKQLMPFVLNFLKMVDAFILKNSDYVLLCSGLHKKVLQSINPSVGMKIVFSGTDLIKKLPLKRGRIIVSLTKWDQGKNPKFLLEIAQRIKGDFLMKIAGNWADDKLKEEFLQKIKSLKLGSKVLVLGRVTEEQKFSLFSEARVLVHPIIEAFGMFALEAAGGGCPVIIPKTSGVTELFTEGKHGFFPTEGDLDGFLTKIQLMLDDEKFASKMSENAYKIAQDYSWKNYTLRIKKIIETLLND